ncbi:MAG: OmpA family protein [Terracidiphilus sp.]|jgi:outer membrane protein OmpA-like peptidoglycan-associated protein
MNNDLTIRSLFPRQIAVFALASAFAIPVVAQDAQTGTTPQTTSPQTVQQPSSTASPTMNQSREGFWGRVYPFARKKWVKRQTDPINDRLSELDEVNAKNAKDIQDVDTRAQAGIRQAQSTADGANQLATTAGQQAQNANGIAQGASGHVDQLNTTVNGLDQYRQVTEADIAFHGGNAVLSAAAKKQLDDFAASASGQQGYILEVEAHSPLGGSAGIQSSQRFAEAVKRYLVTQHEIPVYRMHAVALGNAHSQTDQDEKPVRTSSVHIRLMENSLAAQGAAPPNGATPSTGAERP